MLSHDLKEILSNNHMPIQIYMTPGRDADQVILELLGWRKYWAHRKGQTMVGYVLCSYHTEPLGRRLRPQATRKKSRKQQALLANVNGPRNEM